MRYALFLSVALCLTACAEKNTPPAEYGLTDLRGEWLLVNYWAQWCNPCIQEIPELNAFDKRHSDVSVVGVNFDGASGEELREQERRLGVAFPTLQTDPAAQLGVRRPAVLPTTLLVTPEGEVAATLVGPQTEESLQTALATARGETREP
ncbi:MAG: TlpA disulfide reductase family protein [Halioglobus sp.]|nr:TlpA disulfide reductase family protein [Halioglobus sp.]